ncbi:glycosyltransferase family 2 protein [Francisella salina]|uniref:Glycosyltransferase n=1 Tax=Francisella salina TaxID=573569 RepID=A0ABN3ZPR7_FRAST|nr:glycosyltransferase family 2 protein [Francisella salina]AEI35785.1 Glycosyltransferase [Francisella salina]
MHNSETSLEKNITKSIIIPVYKNESNIPALLKALETMVNKISGRVEIVFVVDGSPDNSYSLLTKMLPQTSLFARLILLSRNFGSFAAIRAGLENATGVLFSVMAADLQEPPELVINSFESLEKDNVDVVVAARNSREDPIFSRLPSVMFWYLYRKMVVKDMPEGGVDMFSCNDIFRQQLLNLKESHSSLIAQIFWLGCRRKVIKYNRLERESGVSAWSFKKKVNYMMDSVFSFTDLPLKLLTRVGFLGMFIFATCGAFTFLSKLFGVINVEGYTTTFLTVGFFGAMNLFGLGIIGSYTWRIYENTKQRPLAICIEKKVFNNDN